METLVVHLSPPWKERMREALDQLKQRLFEAYDLAMVRSLLNWDQTTYMPKGGAPARGRQISLIGRRAHEAFTHVEIGRLLDQLEPLAASLPPDSDDAALIKVTRREYDRATRVPSSFVAEMSQHVAATYQAWTVARPANDFASIRPMLEHTVELSRKYADFFPGWKNVADPFIDHDDHGMTVATIRPLFDSLRKGLVPIVQAIAAKPPTDDSCLRHTAPIEAQLAFGLDVIRRFGYDFERGRQDLTHHPFMTKFSLGDVRITTRSRENDLTDSLFSTLHEAGHAMYEQGIRRDFEGTPLANGTSAGVHESQSRMWENLIGRSRPFWEHFYPKIQASFPAALRDVSVDTFYRAINKVEPSLVRTDADEVTYNLHVMIRFDLEIQLLEGKLAVADLPEAWNARYKSDLGVQAPDHRDGVLQDVHWYGGHVGGAFQGYTLGNILSAQLFRAAVMAKPSIQSETREGTFESLRGWLRENVHQHGAKYTADELTRRATGGPLAIEPYLDYLWDKYAPLYGLKAGERGAVPAGA